MRVTPNFVLFIVGHIVFLFQCYWTPTLLADFVIEGGSGLAFRSHGKWEHTEEKGNTDDVLEVPCHMDDSNSQEILALPSAWVCLGQGGF